MKAALYVRVSTTEQAEEGHSIEAQLDALRAHCARMGWEIAGEYIDAGVSGKLESRPGLDVLMRDAEARAFGIVVVHKLDRFFRYYLGCLKALNRLDKCDVAFVSVVENFDLTTSWGKVILGVMGTLAEVYIDNLSAETKKGKRQRAKEGLTNASILPYGYQRTEDGEVVLDEHEADGIRLAFRAYAAGKHTDAGIATLLNAAGHRTRYTSRWGSRPWTKDTVTITLKNEFYIGLVRHGKEVYHGQHEAIVDRELWDTAQAVRAERRKGRKTAARVYRVYLLNGLARCSICRQTLRVQRSAGHAYYRHTSQLRGLACSAPDVMVREDRLAGEVDAYICGLGLPDDWQAWLRDGLRKNGHDPDVLERERMLLERRRQRLKRLYLDGDVTDQEYQAERQTINDRLTAMTPPETKQLVEAAMALRSMGDVWPGATLEERRDMLRVIFSAVYVDVVKGSITELDSKPEFRPWVLRYPIQEGGDRDD